MKIINPFDYPIIFTSPLRIAPTTWATHVPFGMFLVDLLRPDTLVELGTFYGVSYCAFCQAIRNLGLKTHAYAIDTWRGDKHGGYFGDEILEDLRKHHDPIYGSFSRLIQSTFDDAVTHFSENSIDLLHIDGLHTYEAVKHDFETWLPKLSKRGVVLFHDINVRESDFGVWRLWEELSAKYPSFAMAHGHGLGVLAAGEEFPKTFNLLLEMSDYETVKFKEFFYRLGKEIELQIEHKQQVQTYTAQIAEWDQKVQALTAQLSGRDAQIQALTDQLAEQDVKVKTVNAQLNEIYISKSWKVAMFLRNARVKLIPPGGAIDRFFRGIKKSISIVKNEGLMIFFNRALNKLFPKQHLISSAPADNHFIEPRVSILIPVYNAVQLTQRCIEKLYSVKNDAPFEVIVIDNHSTDGTERFLRRESKDRPNFKYFRMPTNLGFAGAVNDGFLRARGNLIVILNNDTLVTPHWLDRLIQPFNENAAIGIVSPVTNYVGEGPQIDPDAKDIHPEQIDSYAEQIQTRPWIFEPNRLVFFCAAIKREVFDLIGNLDVGYEKGNYEDDDFCLRAILAGFRLAIARNSFVYHFGSATFKENQISHSGFMEKNRKRFYRKVQNLSTVLRPPKNISIIPRVSIIVRTKDRPDLLQKALTSLSNQTFNQFETIIVNDGGEDVSYLLDLFKPYFPVTYIHNKISVGRSAALNHGIQASKGNWISFLDDDDIVYPWHLDVLYSSAESNPEGKFFYTDYNQSLFTSAKEDYSVKVVGVEPWKFDPDELMVNNHIPLHSWLIARECFEKVGLFNQEFNMLEDFEFLIRLGRAYKFFHINRVTCEYRFYLDGVNSIVKNRSLSKKALEDIYTMYPADSSEINAKRARGLEAFDTQIQLIEKLVSQNGTSDPDDDLERRRKIMNIVTGL